MVYFLTKLLMTIFLTNEYVWPERIFIRLNDVFQGFQYKEFNANIFLRDNTTSYILLYMDIFFLSIETILLWR